MKEENNINQNLIPFLVDVTETVTRTVVVWGNSSSAAEKIAETLHRNGTIHVSSDDSDYDSSFEVTGTVPAEDLHCYDSYDQDGVMNAVSAPEFDYNAIANAQTQILSFLRSAYGKEETEDFSDLSRIGLGWTSYEEGSEDWEHPYEIQVYADLINCCVRTYINDILVSTEKYGDPETLCEEYLNYMSSDSMIDITDEEWHVFYNALVNSGEAYKFPPRKEFGSAVRKLYPKGTRILLTSMAEGSLKLPIVEANSTGTVVHVDDAGQIHMHWDNGGSLSLIPGADQFSVIKEEK